MSLDFLHLNVLASYCAANQYSEITTIFSKTSTKECALGVKKAMITIENAFNGDHFRGEGHHEFSNNKKSLFWVFLQIYDLKRSPRNTHIYVLRAFFGFFSFYATSCSLWKLRVNIFQSALNFE